MAKDTPIQSKFGSGRRIGASVTCFIIALLLGIGIHVFVFYRQSQADKEQRPKLIARTIYGQLLQYHEKNARFPKSFAELEREIWNKNAPQKESRLVYGANDYVTGNYHYIYYGDDHVASLWAIPQGKFADEENVSYMLMTPTSFQLWKSGAFSKSDVSQIPRTAVPNTAQMATLGMIKQGEEKGGAKSTGRKGLFKFLPF